MIVVGLWFTQTKYGLGNKNQLNFFDKTQTKLVLGQSNK